MQANRKIVRAISIGLLVVGLSLPAAAQSIWGGFEPPQGWRPPSLHPEGVTLEAKPLGSGVYALISNQPPVDNSGFIVGENGVTEGSYGRDSSGFPRP